MLPLLGRDCAGCEVRDDGEGAYIANIDETAVEPVFTAELLQSTVLDAENGYLSHPYLTCGPYKLVSYDAKAARWNSRSTNFTSATMRACVP